QLPAAVLPLSPPLMHVHQPRLPTSSLLTGHMFFVRLDEQILHSPLRGRGFSPVGGLWSVSGPPSPSAPTHATLPPAPIVRFCDTIATRSAHPLVGCHAIH